MTFTKKLLAGVALAATLAAAGPALASEMLTATFTAADGGVTAGSYSGIVDVTVAGFGQSLGSQLNDAFYLFSGPPTHDGSYYQLTFGTSTLVGFSPAQNAVNFLVAALPAYNASHVYSFKLNTGLVAPGKLHFGVGDGNFSDNSGAFKITVSGGVPEPTTWALMMVGFGGLGACLRASRRKVAVATA